MMNVVETICIEALARLRSWLQGVVLTGVHWPTQPTPALSVQTAR
jgi:hypothetical protein